MFRLVISLGLAAGVGLAAQAGDGEVTVWEGVYTTEQADRGKKAYVQLCRHCHLDNLMGGGQARPLVGEGFVSTWDTLTIGDLYSRLGTTMPADRPGSLSGQITADIVAYLLQENNLPVGKKKLEGNGEALRKIKITKTRS